MVGLCIGVAQGQGGSKDRGGRDIEFSATRSDEVATNLHQLASKKDTLKQLEEDLYKSVQTFVPQSSLDAVAAPPARQPAAPAVSNKRVKELLERRKNWAFANPKDLLSGPTAEELFRLPEYGPDGQEKKSLSPIEQYYEQLAAKRAGKTGSRAQKDDGEFGVPDPLNPSEAAASRDDLNLPAGLRERELALKKLLETDSGAGEPAPGPARNPYSDIFGLGDASSVQENALEHKKNMDEFQRILDSRPPTASSAESAASLGGNSAAARGPAHPLSGLAGAWALRRRDGFDAQLDSINPLLIPSSPPDVNAQVLGQPSQPSLTPAAPKTDLSIMPPPASTFVAPKRVF
jgi:hypothetical protein